MAGQFTLVGDVLVPASNNFGGYQPTVNIPGYPTSTPFGGYAPVPGVPFGLGPLGPGGASPAGAPPQLQFTYDTIGQVIPISIGHVRLGLKTIWVAGVDAGGTPGSATSGGVTTVGGDLLTTEDAAAGDTTLVFGSIPGGLTVGSPILGSNVPGVIVYGSVVTDVPTGETSITISPPLAGALPAGSTIGYSAVYTYQGADSGLPPIGLGDIPSAGTGTGVPAPTITFAAALCAPIDPEEIGNITAVFDGSTQTYSLDQGGLTLPPDWTVTQQQQLAASLGNAIVYPGTEGQEPAALIVADRGANVTNAFRGLRYIIFIDYPIVGSGGSALPRLSIVWRRTNTLSAPKPPSGGQVTAVTFAAGAG